MRRKKKREKKGNFKDFGLDIRRMKLPSVELEEIDKRKKELGYFIFYF